MHPANEVSGALQRTLLQCCFCVLSFSSWLITDQKATWHLANSHCVAQTSTVQRIWLKYIKYSGYLLRDGCRDIQIMNKVTVQAGGRFWIFFIQLLFFSFVVENCRNIIEFCKAYFFSQGSICCVGRADSYIMVIQAVVGRRWWQNKLKLNVRRIYPAGWTSVLFSCLFGRNILIWPRVLKTSRSSFACAGNPPAQMEAAGCNLNKTRG